MKRHALAAAVAVYSLAATAQINAPDAQGMIARAEAMASEHNYTGALDCLRNLNRAVLTPGQTEHIDFAQAEYLYATGSYDAARRAYADFTSRYPFSLRRTQATFGIANCDYAQADYAKALQCYRVIDTGALSTAEAAECEYRRAVCNMECGDRQAARTDLEKAATFHSTRVAALFNLGVLDYEAGDYKAARDRFKNTATATPPGNMTDYYLASMDFAEGDYRRALATSRSMLRRNDLSNSTTAELNRIAGESAFRLGERTDAAEYLKKYIGAVAKPQPSALYTLGVIDYDEGRYDDAVYRFTPVTEQAEGAMRQSAYLYVGQCLLEQGDASAAILAFDKAARATDDDDIRQAAYYNYAVASFAGAGVPFASASETFEEFLKLYPNGPYSDRVASYLAHGYMADKDYGRALKRLDAISHPTPETNRTLQRVLYLLGTEALDRGELKEAGSYLQRAEGLSRYDAAVAAEVVLTQARVLQAEGKNTDAATKYRLYLRMADRNAANRGVALYGLGYSLYGGGKASEAADNFTQALAATTAPDVRADILNRLGDIRFAEGDFAGASDYYAKAFAANPATGDYATLSAARMKGYQRDYQGKLRLLTAFRKDFATSALMPDALLETTQAQISMGDNEGAVATYRTLIADYPQTQQGRRGYLQMAMTLLDMNRTDDALEAYRSVISLYPTSEEAAQASALLRNLYADRGRGDEYFRFMASVNNAPAVSEDDARETAYRSAVKALDSRGDTTQLENFIKRYPASVHTSAAYGLLLDRALAADDKGNADRLAETIMRDYPDSRAAETALRHKATQAYASGDLPEALSSWQTLEAKASDATTATAAHLGVMRTARDMGDYTTAATAADALLASSAGAEAQAEARFTKASALANAGDTDKAVEIWLELAANPADLYGAKSAYEAAAALHESGNSRKALETARKLTASGSRHRYWVARAFILMSDIYTSQGKDFEAREYLEALRENYPGTETDIFMMIDSRLNPQE